MSDLGGFSLHELFRGEAETHAAALSEGLVKLEGTSNPAIVEPLMRAAHSIKGAARVIAARSKARCGVPRMIASGCAPSGIVRAALRGIGARDLGAMPTTGSCQARSARASCK